MQINKTKFTIVVLSAPYGEQGSSSAYQFCKSAIEMGNEISGVFFYQAGVLNASKLVSPATDETNLPQLWSDLAQEKKFPLEVCISAALRQGIVDEQEASQLNLDQFNLKAPFVLSGLGQLVELSAKCDRLITF